MILKHPESELFMRYFDGTLSPEDVAELNDWLRADAGARTRFREVAEQAVMLGDLARTRAWRRPTSNFWPERRVRRRWLVAAAALILGGVIWIVPGLRPGPDRIVTVAEVNGSVSWHEHGTMRRLLKTGERLPAGLVSSEGEGALVQLEFADGTRLTLEGNSELAFSEAGQKRMELKRGSMNALVRPQPAGMPLWVRTATAEVEVLGTVFTLAARAEDTLLNVEQGRVRLRRLVDGREVEVPSRHVAVASLDPATQLGIEAIRPVSSQWRQSFAKQPRAGWRGEWLASDATGPGRLGSIAYLAGRKADGSPIMHRGIVGRTAPAQDGRAFVALESGSIFELYYRTAAPRKVMIFISTQRPDGGFGGNFEVILPPNAGELDDEGWRRLRVPLQDFQSVPSRKQRRPEGCAVMLILVSTRDQPGGLEVAELGVFTPTKLAQRP